MPKRANRLVDSLKSDGHDVVHWDVEMAGFGVCVRPSRQKSYIVKCRCSGRELKVTIGTHGPIALERARTKARRINAEAKAGHDPSAEHARMRKSPTMKQLGRRFLDEYVPIHCRPTTEREYRRSVELFFNPETGTRKVIDIERTDTAKLHYGLGTKPCQANRALSVLSALASRRPRR